MRKVCANADSLIGQIARNQHGVVTIAQLRRAGLSHAGVTRRVQAGRLHRLYRGVYAVGHTNLSREGRWMAAVLACGPGAALSHESAAHLWGRAPRSPAKSHVTVPGLSGRRKREGIRLHYSAMHEPSDLTRRRNIPVTTLARTARDLGWFTDRARSDLEREFLRIVRSHKLPLPEVNVRVGPYEVDFLWRREGLVVEIDGWAYHRTRASFEADRARDRDLALRGLEVMRFADRELSRQPELTAIALQAQLKRLAA